MKQSDGGQPLRVDNCERSARLTPSPLTILGKIDLIPQITIKRRHEVEKLLAGLLVLGMVFIAGIATAQQGTQNNPTHSIDLSQAKSTVNNVTNAGAVSNSTGTVQGSTTTVHVTTPPPGSIPGSGGRASDIRQMKNNPPPPPAPAPKSAPKKP